MFLEFWLSFFKISLMPRHFLLWRIIFVFRAILRSGRIRPKSNVEGLFMKNQTIHCSVSSCRHHNTQNGCDLNAINVCANCNCHSGKSDESMCGSYECGCK